MGRSQAPDTGGIATCADSLASAALREPSQALIVAFDSSMRVVVHAGAALAREDSAQPAHTGEAIETIFPPALWSGLEHLFRSALEGETRSHEMWIPEQERYLLIDVGPLWVADGGEVAGGVAVVRHGTARAQAQPTTAAPRVDAFEEVFERAPIGTGLLDPQWRWLLVNRALCEITGYAPDELIGRRFEELVVPLDEDADARARRQLEAGELRVLRAEQPYVNAAGERLAAIVSVSLVRDQAGGPLHYIAQLQDISERKQLEERLRHLADHDPLTGLRNRRLFDDDLAHQVARSRRYGEPAGLILLDLDSFKRINDAHGHGAGDETLRAVARAIRARLRATDLVARLGGDEFAALLPHIDEAGLATVAEGLRRVISACTIEVGEGVLHPSASVGCAPIDSHSSSAEAVFAEADSAMYQAKRAA